MAVIVVDRGQRFRLRMVDVRDGLSLQDVSVDELQIVSRQRIRFRDQPLFRIVDVIDDHLIALVLHQQAERIEQVEFILRREMKKPVCIVRVGHAGIAIGRRLHDLIPLIVGNGLVRFRRVEIIVQIVLIGVEQLIVLSNADQTLQMIVLVAVDVSVEIVERNLDLFEKQLLVVVDQFDGETFLVLKVEMNLFQAFVLVDALRERERVAHVFDVAFVDGRIGEAHEPVRLQVARVRIEA